MELPSKEWIQRRIAKDPDVDIEAGGYVENPLRKALIDLMAAYERRIRTDCTQEQLAAEPWRCLEYVAAERALERDENASVKVMEG